MSSSMLGQLDGADMTSVSPWKSQESCVVKVFMETGDKKAATTFYKSIMVSPIQPKMLSSGVIK